MSDCDFEEGELLDQSENLLTEAEFFGYQTPKGRQILLSIGSEKALTILINSPATTLAEALDLTEELLDKNAHADTETFAHALMDKGLTFEHVEGKKFLRNQLDVLLAFIERAIANEDLHTSVKALALIYKNQDWKLADRRLAEVLYAANEVRGLAARQGSADVMPELDVWIPELTSEVILQVPNLALLKSKKACAVTEIVVSYCICIENFEAAWTFLVDYLSASKKIECHSQPIINLVHALEILKPRRIALKALLNFEPELLGDIGLITTILARGGTTVEEVSQSMGEMRDKVLSSDPVVNTVKRAALAALRTNYVELICAQIRAGKEIRVDQVERELDLPLLEFAKYLALDVQIAGEWLVRKSELLEAEMQTIFQLGQRVESVMRQLGK